MKKRTHELLSTSGLRLLVGEWRGRGVADFPTIERVDYVEELQVEWDPGRDVLCYEQQVVLPGGGPSHRESGFIRVVAGGEVELWNAQDNGRTEVLRGSSEWDDSAGQLRLDLRGVAFGNDPRMLKSRRLLTVNAEQLRYEVSMATTATAKAELLPHLRCDLTRTRS